LERCKFITDFSPISKLERLENLNVNRTNFSDISILENNKSIKKLYFENCFIIEDFTPISKFEKLEVLYLSETEISDLSILEKIKILKN